MKKIYSMILIAFMIIALSSCSKQAEDDTTSTQETNSPDETNAPKEIRPPREGEPDAREKDSFQLYDDSTIGIQYPSDWDMQQTGFDMMLAIFLSPKEGPSDIFQDNVNIIMEDTSSRSEVGDMSLEKYGESSINQLKLIITEFADFEESDTVLSSLPAKKHTFTGTQGNFNLKWLQTYAIKDGKAYVITYTAEAGVFDSNIDKVERMINSFEIK